MKTRLLLILLQLSLVLVPPARAQGWPWHALSFDGVDDWVDMTVPLIPTRGDFTVSCWVYAVGSTNVRNMAILSQGSAGNAFYLGLTSGRIRCGDGWSDTGWVFPMDSWHHFAVVKTDTNTHLYLDGRVLVSHGAPIPNPGADTGFRLGRQYGAYAEHFAGRIADVRIFNRPLNEEDIRASWEQPAEFNDPGLVAGWRFDEMALNKCISVGLPPRLLPVKTLVFDGTVKPTTAAIGVPPGIGLLVNGPGWLVLPDSPARLSGNSASYTQSSPGDALAFNGWDNWVDTGVAAIPASGNFTVECWANCSRVPEDLGRGEILSQGSAGNAFYIGVRDGILRLGDGWESTGFPFPMGAWHHFAVVKTGGETRFFLDGTNVLNRGWAIPNPSGDTVLRLGRQYGNHGENWPGAIDEVRVWSRALSEGEIRTGMYYAPEGPVVMTSGLEAYWPMSGSTANRGADMSGRGHHLDLTTWPAAGWVAGMGWVPTINWPLDWNGGNPMIQECHQPFPTTFPNCFVTALAGGYSASYAAQGDSRPVFWGSSGPGRLGAPPNIEHTVAIAASQYNWMSMQSDGHVVVWGLSESGRLKVPQQACDVVAIAIGTGTALALRSDGNVVQWGRDVVINFTYCGLFPVPAAATNIVAIGGKFAHHLAARADGRVIAWGNNNWGQCVVPAAATNAVAVDGGEGHSLVLRADGTVVAWGMFSNNETSVPASATNVVAISTYKNHNLALRADGTVVAWGKNDSGQCNVPGYATNIVAISAGVLNSLALRADGAVLAWGYNLSHQSEPPYGVPAPIQLFGNVDPDTPGIYKLSYGITNHLGKVAVRTRTVLVRDTTPPKIVLNGTNLDLVPVGSGWVDPGVVASDTCAGDLTSSVVVSGSPHLDVPGAYLVRYTATDPSGNSSYVERTVYVGIPPVVTSLSSAYDSAETFFGTCNARLRATVNPNGLPTAVFFEYGQPGGGANSVRVDLPPSLVATNVAVIGSRLNSGGGYPWRVIVTNVAGMNVSAGQAVAIPEVPSLHLISGFCVTNDPITSGLIAEFRATANPNGHATRVTFELGRTTNYLSSVWFDIGSGREETNLVYTRGGLVPNFEYHWRMVASNEWAVVASPDYKMVAQVDNSGGLFEGGLEPGNLAGDLNGDHVVSREEMQAVMSSYITSGMDLQMTDVNGLGQVRILATVPDIPDFTYWVDGSSDFVNWEAMGMAQLRYEFVDTNAPSRQQRYYRLVKP